MDHEGCKKGFDECAGACDTPHTGGVRIETPRLILREIEPADEARMYEMTSKPEMRIFSFEDTPDANGKTVNKHFDGTKETFEEFMAICRRTRTPDPVTGKRDKIMMVIERKDTNEVVGHVSIERTHYIPGDNYEVNHFIDAEHQRFGFGREALAGATYHGFEKMGLFAYTAVIRPDNAGSQKSARIQGYRKIAEVELGPDDKREKYDLFILVKQDFYDWLRSEKRDYVIGFDRGAPPQTPAP